MPLIPQIVGTQSYYVSTNRLPIPFNSRSKEMAKHIYSRSDNLFLCLRYYYLHALDQIPGKENVIALLMNYERNSF